MTKPIAYTTVKGYGETEISIQRSRFIAYINRVDTEEEAVDFVQKIAKKHWDATHNCYAYIVQGENEVQRSSDDGEPAGTAGRPILEVIKSRELTNTAIVITRYFGGIKLGAGGLIRAYSSSASAGLDNTGLVDWNLQRKLTVTVDYPSMGKVEHALRQSGFELEKTRFTEVVTFPLWVPEGSVQAILDMVAEQTSGSGLVHFHEREHRPHPR
ncbi:YigZ family protein [Salinithrix halophila]|uniref:YigZ family protein n=1 Tax=Salinithrix halophila TaxID=1485204 RepID=A0ABV8JJ86_9BACL